VGDDGAGRERVALFEFGGPNVDISRVRSLLALALGLAALGFSSGPEAEQPTGRFVFVGEAETSAASVLWTLRTDRRGLRRVTRSLLTAELEPEWSPDGRKIVYSRSDDCRADPYALCRRIWTVNGDGSGERRLTPLRLPGQLAGRAFDFSQPTWSPDGRHVAYVQSIESTSTSNLYVIDADGSGRRRLTRLPNADGPAWSPDGKEIAFEHAVERGRGADIFVLELATGRLRRLTRTRVDESSPQWSPDGRQIAYEQWDLRSESSYEVFVMNTDGTGRRNLSRRRGVDVSPVWSPGGELIAFLSERAGIDDGLGIYITAADGSGRPRRVRSPAAYELDWGREPG
jgi:Tol biopolymer transport system component